MKKIGVLVIHGIGDQEPDFADRLEDGLRNRLGDQWNELVFRGCHWAPILQTHQEKILYRVSQAHRLSYHKLRQFIVSSLGDAALYLMDHKHPRSSYAQIHELFRTDLKIIEEDLDPQGGMPLIILAESLGTVITTNYLWDQQHGNQPLGGSPFQRMETLTKLITFGSNIPLFIPPSDNLVNVRFPPPALPAHLRPVAKWLNVFDREDILGYPLNDLYDTTQGTEIEDLPMEVGFLPISLTPLSHTIYKVSRRFQNRVVEEIRSVLQQVDAVLAK